MNSDPAHAGLLRPRMPASRQWAMLAAVALLCFAGFAAWATYFFPFFSDDALISMRYAERLSAGEGLTWTDGERVEGYSDLLWVLILAALHWFDSDVILAARVVGILGALAAVVGVCVPRQPNLREAVVRAVGSGWVLAGSAPLAVWAIGGLEHGFMAGVLTGAVWWHLGGLEAKGRRRRKMLAIAGLHYATLALLRLDGALFVGVGGISTLWYCRRSRPLGAAVLVGLPSAMALIGQLIFRISYYGEWIPNSARVKISPSAARLFDGFAHVSQGSVAASVALSVALGLTVFAFFGSGAPPAHRTRWTVPWAMVAAWLSYLAFVGGDIFPGWRQLLLAWIPLAFVVSEGAVVFAQRQGGDQGGDRLTVARLLPLIIVAHIGIQTWDSENQRAKDELWEWDGLPVGDLLHRAFGARQPLLAVDAAGALPYWSKLPSLDMLGLNDAHIAKHPPSGFGYGQIGHELGDGAYVWDRAPDILAFNGSVGSPVPSFLSGRTMRARGDFSNRYGLIQVQGSIGTRSRGYLYIRKDGVLGVESEDGGLRIPGYFFSLTTPRAAELDAQDRLRTPIGAREVGRADRIRLPRGRWRLRAVPGRDDVRWGFSCNRGNAQPIEGGARDVIELHAPTSVNIALTHDGELLMLREAQAVAVSESTAGWRCISSQTPLRVKISNLPGDFPRGSFWASPDNLILSSAGVRIDLEGESHARSIELSTDNNDHYRFDFVGKDEVLAGGTIQPTAQPGMALRRITVPADVRTAGFDVLYVRPVRGDGAFCLGHLKLHP